MVRMKWFYLTETLSEMTHINVLCPILSFDMSLHAVLLWERKCPPVVAFRSSIGLAV
uniref:Uncharacterized protein n=1 Tax=Arundo donax TaxID=35708 RepID=A0A0A9BZ34_ARUDO